MSPHLTAAETKSPLEVGFFGSGGSGEITLGTSMYLALRATWKVAHIGCPADVSNSLLESSHLTAAETKSPLEVGFFGSGGSGEIRTHDRVAPMPVFKTGAFNHSATLPNF